MTDKTNRPAVPPTEKTSKKDEGFDTQRSGFADIKGGDAEKPGQSPHDEKQAPDKTD
jgi:hypothetical protein